MKSKLKALFFGLVSSFFLLEIFAQLFYFLVVKKQFEAIVNEPNFYLQQSQNELLGYQLKPNFKILNDAKIMITNQDGLREKGVINTNKKLIGLLGDSVVFGMSQDQDSTLTSRLNLEYAGDSLQFVNLGVPGYNTFQEFEFLKKHLKKTPYSSIIYVLNPNDFTLLNTVYEGADNGNYRYFNVPFLKSPWFIRKVIYRYHKKGEITFNTDFYKWCFEGTHQQVFDEIVKMKTHLTQNKVDFKVLVLPAGSAYQSTGYTLNEMYSKISNHLKINQIKYTSPVSQFLHRSQVYFDSTDHFTHQGNTLLINEIKNLAK